MLYLASLFKRAVSSPTLKLGARGFGRHGDSFGLVGSSNIISIYRRVLVSALTLKSDSQVARPDKPKAADVFPPDSCGLHMVYHEVLVVCPWSGHGLSMVYLWSIYGLSMVYPMVYLWSILCFCRFQAFRACLKKRKDFLFFTPESEKRWKT